MLFQSTLPVRGATMAKILGELYPSISIHAPRAGSDGGNAKYAGSDLDISIHAPRAGSDCLSRY